MRPPRLALPLAISALCLAQMASGAGAAERVVPYRIVDAREIPESLTGQTGDPEAGRRLYFDLGLTHCSGCHGSPGGPGAQAVPGRADSPSLAGVGGRLSEGAIRLWLVAPQAIRPGTAMPSFYAAGQRDDPEDPLFGEPLLSAAEIEDIVAYLMRQAEPRQAEPQQAEP